MFSNPNFPNLPDYISFLTNVVGIPAVNLPPDFTGTGTVDGNELTILTVVTGNLYVNAELYDSDDFIPLNTAVSQILTGTGGVGTYLISNQVGPLSWLADSGLITADSIATADGTVVEDIGAYNGTVVMTLSLALDIVNDTLLVASPSLYTLAVYNLATDRLLNFAPDIPDQTYFQDLRGPKQLNLNTMSVGVVSSSTDNGTGMTYLNPEQMKTFTLMDLQTLKTPYGRAYMGLAQQYGRTIWGVT